MKIFALLAGTAAVAAAILLSRLGEMLFAAHMTQHLLLIVVAAPLLVMGGLRLGLPPLGGWTAFVTIFLFWHLPPAFRWAALHPLGELLEMASILVAAICFWSGALGAGPLSGAARALMVMSAAVLTDLPGVVMLFAPTPICTMPAEDAARFGLTPLADQQLAGLLMWVPANLVFFGVATTLFARWMRGSPLPSSSPPVPS